MTILTSIPTEQPKPMEFVKDGREIVDKVLLKVRQDFARSHSEVVKEWVEWVKECAPANDSVDQHVKRHGMHVPLGNILFSNEPLNRDIVVPPENDE